MDDQCQWTIKCWAEYEEEMMELGRTWHEDPQGTALRECLVNSVHEDQLAFDREETEMECKRERKHEINYMKMFSIEDLPVVVPPPQTLLNPAWNGVLLRSEARRLAMRKKLAKHK